MRGLARRPAHQWRTTSFSLVVRTTVFPDSGIESCIENVRLARIRLGRGPLLGLRWLEGPRGGSQEPGALFIPEAPQISAAGDLDVFGSWIKEHSGPVAVRAFRSQHLPGTYFGTYPCYVFP